MARGGIFDQIGGGFHRYSTDARWLVPHFEKMLYDNALIPVNYAEAYQLTKKEFYLDVMKKTLDFVLREMASAPWAAFTLRTTRTLRAWRAGTIRGPSARFWRFSGPARATRISSACTTT